MNEPRFVGHYAEFVKLCRGRIEELKIPYATVDEMCGFPERYTNALLSGGKAMSVYSLFTMADSLALRLAFFHDAEKLAEFERRDDWIKLRRTGPRWRARHPRARHKKGRDYYKIVGRKGGMAWARKRTRGQRKVAARRAALARWSKNAKR